MRAVIFDLDGTLIDSAPDIAAVVNRVLAADGLAPHSLEAVRGMIGDGAKQLLERAFAAHGVRAEPRHLAAFLVDYNANPVVETVAYAGIPPVLAELREAGHPLGVCTNKPIGPALKILDALDLAAFFGTVVGGDSTPYKKPDPRHLAAALAGLEVGEAVMIGDHDNDMLAAAGLGLPGIFATWGYGQTEAVLTAHTPLDLPELIARLEG
ncbi:MAG TPA: HAD-IA family hydrolase [Acidocella sp.]|nr:HAD-IA family hydrolase [Acidocella sp.]